MFHCTDSVLLQEQDIPYLWTPGKTWKRSRKKAWLCICEGWKRDSVVEVNVKNNSPKVIRNIILGIQLYYLLTIKLSAKTLLRRTYQTSCLLLASVIH